VHPNAVILKETIADWRIWVLRLSLRSFASLCYAQADKAFLKVERTHHKP